MEDTIHRKSADNEADAPHAEFIERLDGPDLDHDIEQRTVADIMSTFPATSASAASGATPRKGIERLLSD